MQAVLFDADGVLQRPGDDHRDALARLCGGGDDPARRAAFLEDVFAAEYPSMTGGGDFAVPLAEVLRSWNADATIEEALRMWTTIHVFDGVREVVSAVRDSGTPCCLATNQERHRGTLMSQALGFASLFDREFYSWRLGVAKPHPAYFETILARLALPADAVLLLDDRRENVAAARGVGLHAAVVEPVPDAERAAQLRGLLGGYGLP